MKNEDDNEQQMKTELAFCHLAQIKEELQLFNERKSIVNNKEKDEEKKKLLKNMPIASNELLKVGFLFEAIKLHKISYRMIIEDTRSDEQTINYLNYLLYYDDMYLMRNQIQKQKHNYLNDDNQTESELFKIFREFQGIMIGDSVLHNPFFNTLIGLQLFKSP